MELSKEENILRMRMQLIEQKSYWDIKDVAIKTGLSIATIRRRLKDGLIRKMQTTTGGKLLFKPSHILEWLENGGR